jgi:dUTP pyrophosphatase
MTNREVQVELINSSGFDNPKYETAGAAGMDVFSTEEVLILPSCTIIIKTGLKVAVPEGFELQVRPRSGLSAKTSLRIANAPGTIDSDYRGEIGIIITNINPYENELILRGARIAQLVLAPVYKCVWKEVEVLSSTERGEGGFGSTGISK